MSYGYEGNCKYEAVYGKKVFDLPFAIQTFEHIKNHTLGEDDFDREVLGGNWSCTGGDWDIVDGHLKGSGGKHISSYSQEKMKDGDVTAKLKIVKGVAPFIGLVQRMRANDEYIVVWLTTVDGGQVLLQEMTSAGMEILDWVGYPIEEGREYNVRFELLGDIHRVWIDEFPEANPAGEPVLQGSQILHKMEGYCGFMVDASTVGLFDDFKITDYRIFNAFDTEERQMDYEEYSDLCFVASAVRWNQRMKKEAIRLFEKGLSYWDGIGFRDPHFGYAYTTYQVALCLKVAKKIKFELGDLGPLMESTMWNLQREDGGIITHYTSDLEPYGCSEANCETTAMAILAYEESDRSKAKDKK